MRRPRRLARLGLARDRGDRRRVARSLHTQGVLALEESDFTRGEALLSESLLLSRELGYKAGMADAGAALGVLLMLRG
jgi:hypothetical protein